MAKQTEEYITTVLKIAVAVIPIILAALGGAEKK